MSRETEIKNLLISNAIQLVAEGGFEKATTKELTHYKETTDFKMNEVYIYRLFGGKENLYEAAFITLDNELFEALRAASRKAEQYEGTPKEKLYTMFLEAWSFVLKNKERCRCYVRYYYSVYFKDKSLEAHNKMFERIVCRMAPIFKEEADVSAIMHSVFTAFLDFAIRVHKEELEDNEINRPHVFNVLYCMMMSYLKSELVNESISAQIA